MRYRHEHKYIEGEADLAGIRSRLGAFMKKDPHVSEKGFYTVRSLYFDDHHDRFLQENIDGADEREKWRIRIYDANDGYISLEQKLRRGDLIAKRTCPIDADAFRGIIKKEFAPPSSAPPLYNLFVKEIKTGLLHPAVIVEYERTPFVFAGGNTRITIDRNIRSSSDTEAFLSKGPLNARPVLPSGMNLLEVKYDDLLPSPIADAIEHGRMRREPFSKYYLARKFPYNGLRSGFY